jgi:hypothetical protein
MLKREFTEVIGFLSTRNLKGSRKYYWGRVFASPVPKIAEALAPFAERAGCKQKILKDSIIWQGRDKNPEIMFCFIPEPSDLKAVRAVYGKVAKLNPILTFVIVHQKSDGIGSYDIFRLSRISYLEHYNRVYNRK